MKIFTYVGSGKGEHSNTLRYINKLLLKTKELVKFNLEIKIFHPGNSKILNCLGCTNCFINGECPLDKKDDMQTIKKEMLSSDIIIFGSPIYGANISGNMKIFLDRVSYWYHLFALRGKSGLFILTSCGNGANFTLNFVNFIMQFLGIHVIDLYNVNVFHRNQIELDSSIKDKLKETASLLFDYMSGNKEPKSNENLEKMFSATKNNIFTAKKSKTSEYLYWEKHGMFECETFAEVLERTRRNN